MLKSLYVEGDTFLHRTGTKSKLALLLVFGLGLYFVSSVIALATATAVTGAIYLSLGMSLREAESRIRPVLFTIAVLGLVNAWVLSPNEALESTLRLLAILFLAASITATTTISAFMDALHDILQPLDRLGLVNAADISLALGLVLRFVPDIFGHYESLREAHIARGIPVKTSKMIGPLIITALKNADTIAEAIDARGIRTNHGNQKGETQK